MNHLRNARLLFFNRENYCVYRAMYFTVSVMCLILRILKISEVSQTVEIVFKVCGF